MSKTLTEAKMGSLADKINQPESVVKKVSKVIKKVKKAVKGK